MFRKKNRKVVVSTDQATLSAIDGYGTKVMEDGEKPDFLGFSGKHRQEKHFDEHFLKRIITKESDFLKYEKKSSKDEEEIEEFDFEGAVLEIFIDQKSKDPKSIHPLCRKKMGKKMKEALLKVFTKTVFEEI